MIRLGPVTIMKSRTHDAYRDVVMYAWILQQAVWYGGEGHDYSDLQKATLDLAGALSYAPIEDAPK
jgi:hypothetical protein